MYPRFFFGSFWSGIKAQVFSSIFFVRRSKKACVPAFKGCVLIFLDWMNTEYVGCRSKKFKKPYLYFWPASLPLALYKASSMASPILTILSAATALSVSSASTALSSLALRASAKPLATPDRNCFSAAVGCFENSGLTSFSLLSERSRLPKISKCYCCIFAKWQTCVAF